MKLLKRIIAVTMLIAVIFVTAYAIFTTRCLSSCGNLAVDLHEYVPQYNAHRSAATSATYCVRLAQIADATLLASLNHRVVTGGQFSA